MCLEPFQAPVSIKKKLRIYFYCLLSFFILVENVLFSFPFCSTASPHTSSTPNINTVRHADSRGSLISTDSANSLLERNNDKGNSLDKVLPRRYLCSNFIFTESLSLLTRIINILTVPVVLAAAHGEVCAETLC